MATVLLVQTHTLSTLQIPDMKIITNKEYILSGVILTMLLLFFSPGELSFFCLDQKDLTVAGN